jgi:hypothetical protein
VSEEAACSSSAAEQEITTTDIHSAQSIDLPGSELDIAKMPELSFSVQFFTPSQNLIPDGVVRGRILTMRWGSSGATDGARSI